MKITDFDIKINKENVLMLIDCYPDSPVYEEVVADFQEIISEAYEKLSPSAVLEFGNLSDYDLSEYGIESNEVIFCIESVGNEISKWATLFFEEGNYVKGMLADAIADDCLFQMDRMIEKVVKNLCQERNYGVRKRLEAPQDISMKIQRTAWEKTRAEEEIGLKIKESYMLDPIKSNCQVYLVQEGYNEFRTEHDCSRCPMKECKMRHTEKVSLTVQQGGKTFLIEGKKNQILMNIFQNSGIYIPAICAGTGKCGKCKVRFERGCTIPSKEERIFFSTEELEEGWRLACKAVVSADCVVYVEMIEDERFSIVTEYDFQEKKLQKLGGEFYGIAVDIGTTTIVMQLIDLQNKVIVDTYTSINRQRIYGADVISRIQASNEGKEEQLKQRILENLKEGLEVLLKNQNVVVNKMSISGNTTMIHLLMGYSCKSLGIYPFIPINSAPIDIMCSTLFGDQKYEFPVYVYPWISTYVGGDIMSGLVACGFADNEKISMLIDLGTNGEMAIGNREKILVASAAAGPAFEGGNIICGIGSIPGAISDVEYVEGEFQIKTIGDQEIIGICGTGVIAITYELLQNSFIDETGHLCEEYFEKGVLLARTKEREIRFYQKDIREIQLAKSAIRAGIETIIQAYGVEWENIDTIYIAGGFGYKLAIDKAIGIGMLPNECRNKIKLVGNSSLKGSILYLMESNIRKKVDYILDISEEIQLAQSREFGDFYMRYMFF